VALAIAGPALGYPVTQLPPGHVTVARVATVQGAVAIGLHRIRYLGKVALCMSESNGGGTSQSCANYPLGPGSDQPIGHNPVWWTTFVGACTPHHFQVISGVILRAGLTAWLHSPAGLARMSIVAVPKAFGVRGGLVYALIADYPATVTLRDRAGRALYTAPVEPLTGVPTLSCGAGAGSSWVTVGTGAPEHAIP
jgi:hypothetical protein